MSFNIRYGTADDGDNSWRFRKEFLLELIRRESPHILGLQEALRFQLDEIRSSLPQFAEAGSGRDDGHLGGEYAALLFDTTRFTLETQGTFWFSDTPSLPGSIGWGNNVTRICTWARLYDRIDARIVNVYNLHLDHESQPSRYRSVQSLIDTIRQRSSEDPVLILGDFNAGELNPALLLLRDNGFVDTYRAVHPHDSLVGTFNAFRGVTQGEKIDYILTDVKASVMNAAILRDENGGRYPSDHFPLTARIQFSESR
jgi:endonuclease/exonuclease/phosphatase family metal-dependent hydrolase